VHLPLPLSCPPSLHTRCGELPIPRWEHMSPQSVLMLGFLICVVHLGAFLAVLKCW
jgi:hypothetical protein